MSKHKSDGKDKKKGSQLVIRVDKAERDAFVSLCDRQDTSAAREIRRFMRERVAAATDGAAEATLIEDAKDTAPNDEAATAQPEADIDPKADDAEPPKKKHKHHRH